MQYNFKQAKDGIGTSKLFLIEHKYSKRICYHFLFIICFVLILLYFCGTFVGNFLVIYSVIIFVITFVLWFFYIIFQVLILYYLFSCSLFWLSSAVIIFISPHPIYCWLDTLQRSWKIRYVGVGAEEDCRTFSQPTQILRVLTENIS